MSKRNRPAIIGRMQSSYVQSSDVWGIQAYVVSHEDWHKYEASLTQAVRDIYNRMGYYDVVVSNDMRHAARPKNAERPAIPCVTYKGVPVVEAKYKRRLESLCTPKGIVDLT